MVPSEKSPPFKSTWLTWLTFGLLGLAAMLCGLILPQSLRGLRQPTAAIPAPAPPQEKKDAADYNPPGSPEIAPSGSILSHLVLGTIVVLVLCCATLWAGKRWIRPLTMPTGGSRNLRILESLPLGGRCSVFLLQAEGAKVLVGVDQTGIKALLQLPQKSSESTLAEVTGEIVDLASL